GGEAGDPADSDLEVALGDLEVEVTLDPVEAVVGDIDLVFDLGAGSSDGDPADSDLDVALGDLEVEGTLDPVEAVVGDVDIGLDLDLGGIDAILGGTSGEPSESGDLNTIETDLGNTGDYSETLLIDSSLTIAQPTGDLATGISALDSGLFGQSTDGNQSSSLFGFF
ncbi:hypothetical protein LX81_03770, partial [Palleronia aestuarii]